MTIASVSTQYLGTAMLAPVSQAQAQLAQLEIESSTGQFADLGLHLTDQSGYELSLRNQNDLLQTLTTANGVTTANMATVQSALASITANAQTTMQSLATWTTGNNSSASLQSLGQNGLQQFIAAANTTSGDQYILGGVNSTTPPIADYFSTPAPAAQTALAKAFQSTFGFAPTSSQASTITASAMQSFLSGPVAAQFSGADWTGTWSSASSVNPSAEIAPGPRRRRHWAPRRVRSRRRRRR